MNGPVAQLVALACQGNAFLRHLSGEKVFPGRSVYQFCEFVRFRDGDKEVSDDPDSWFARLKDEGISGLVVGWSPSGAPAVPDYQMAGFANGGGTLSIGTRRPDGFSDYWAADWRVGNREAADRRIWQVVYQRLGAGATSEQTFRPLEAVASDFEAALTDIHAFAVAMPYAEGFANCFARGLSTLKGDGENMYHEDIFIPGLLPPLAERMLRAASHAWVFGGMGSWNDTAPEDYETYHRVTDRLYRTLMEAVVTSASGSCAGLNKASQAL